MGRPSYVVFDEDYSAAEITRLLGVVVTDVSRPLDKSIPEVKVGDKLDFVDKYLLSIRAEKGIHINTTAIRGTKAEANLVSIFSLSGNWRTVDTYDLTSEDLWTVSLHRMEDVFADLMNAHGDKIRELLRSPSAKNGAYMLVGFKAAKNPTIEKSSKMTKDASFSASSKGIGAALGHPLPVEVSATASREMSRDTLLKSTVERDRAFAGLYVKLVWKVDGVKLFPGGKVKVKREVVQSGIYRPGQDVLAFAGQDAEEEIDSEDEAEVEDLYDAVI
jgi:hypothetical protein